MFIEGIDETDEAILKVIENDARLTYSEIGQQVGISRVAVKKRMTALEERGIIEGYKTIVNPTGDPNGVKFIIDIEAEPEKFHDVIENLAGYSFNRQIYTLSGESNIHVVGYAPNFATYKTNVDQVFRKLKGVRRISCKQVLVTHKDIDGGVEYVRYKESEDMEGEPAGTSSTETTD